MNIIRKTLSLILILVCIFSLCAVSASAEGLQRARDIFDPSGMSREEEEAIRLQETLDQLAYEAWCCYEDMAIPNLRDMLRKAEIKYVQGTYGQGIYATDAPDGDENLRVLPDGTKLTVYARHGGYSFVRTADGFVCWCRSDLLVNTFNQEVSLMRMWNAQYQSGLNP